MTTRIEKDFFFQAAVRFDKIFYLNMYELTISMLVETDNIREQNIAIERLNYFLHNVIENSVFVVHTDVEAIECFEKAGIKVCTTPEEPYDQIISMLLILKLNAIMENKLFITDMILGSKLSDGIKFSMVPEVAESIYKDNNWYNDSCINMRHTIKSSKRKDKIVKLFEIDNWADIGLGWKDKTKTNDKILVIEPKNKH